VVVGIRARTSHVTSGNAGNSFGGRDNVVLVSTGTETALRRIDDEASGVAGGVKAGVNREGGGS
jgi:hypothetical protein